MKYKEKKFKDVVDHQFISQELTRLAGDIGEKIIKVDGEEVKIAPNVYFKKVVKCKEGNVSVEISIKADRSGQELTTKGNKEPSAFKKGMKRPYQAKKIKKAMGSCWKEVVRCVKEGRRYGEKEVFFKLLEDYSKITEPEWDGMWQECAVKSRQIIELLERGEREQAQALVAEVTREIKSCHKTYK